MAICNEILVPLVCPRCGQESEMVVDLYFGQRDQLTYRLGEQCAWVPGKAVRNGGSPADGDLDGESYTECPLCRKDFFVCC